MNLRNGKERLLTQVLTESFSPPTSRNHCYPNAGNGSGGCNWRPLEVLHQRLTQDSVPALGRCQLPRSCAQLLKKGGYPATRRLRPRRAAMGLANRHPGLPRMAGLLTDGLQEQRSAGDGLGVLGVIGQPYEQTPPVVDQRSDACHQPAAFEILRGDVG